MHRSTALHPAHRAHDGIDGAARRLHRDVQGAVLRPGDAGYDAGRRTIDPAFDAAAGAHRRGRRRRRRAGRGRRRPRVRPALRRAGHRPRHARPGRRRDPRPHRRAWPRPRRPGAPGRARRRRRALGRRARRGRAVRARAAVAARRPTSASPATRSAAGVGWLAREHGFAADSLVRAEVVTAEGAIVAASADQHPDLFWALRGGGGSFGVVTAMEFAAVPGRAGLRRRRLLRAASARRDVLARYRDWIADAPDELSHRRPHPPRPARAGGPGRAAGGASWRSWR